MRASITGYLRFLLLSFSSTWPTLYGGLPMMTVIGAFRWRATRAVFSSVNIISCRFSAKSSVSTKHRPSNGS